MPVGASGHSGWRIEMENVDANPNPTFQQIVENRDGGGERNKDMDSTPKAILTTEVKFKDGYDTHLIY